MSALETPVELLQRDDEFELLLGLYRERQPKRVLEVGTLHGGSLYHWLQNAQPGTLVVSVDDQNLNAPLYDSWCADGVEWTAVLGDSHHPATAAKVRQHGPFDWVYIDAGHLENEVRADWDTYQPMCAADAVVVFHDILKDEAYPHIQVWKLWQELKTKYRCAEIGVDTGVLYL